MLIKMGAYHIPDKARQLRALYGWMWGWPGKKTLFMGSEFGQSAEWAYDKSLDWHLLQYLDHEGIRLLVADLNRFYLEHEFLPQSDYDQKSFQWVNSNDGNNSVISFVRFGANPDEVLLVVANMTPVTRPHYRVGVPREGRWVEALNTEAKQYGGSGEGNPAGVEAQPIKWDGRPFAVDVFLPGMSVLFLLPERKVAAVAPTDTPAAGDSGRPARRGRKAQ
jgi:1,4-alpha-glucan branching enzyme